LSYCAEEVRRHDRDRFLTALAAPADKREALFALYAFNIEISKIREIVSETMLGSIRLQWWREAIAGIYGEGAIRKHAVVEALLESVRAHPLSRRHFDVLIDGRELDLEELPPADIRALLDYTDATSGALVLLAMEALAGALEEAETEAGRAVGRAWALIGLLRAMPYRLQRGRIDLPVSLADKHSVDRRQMLNLKPSPELAAAAEELAGLARRELSAARALRRQVRGPARAALLPAALADGYLRRLARVDHNVFDRRLADPPGLASLRLAYRSTIGRY